MSGMDIDPAMMQQIMRQLQGVFANAGESGVSWDMAKRQALHIANQEGLGVTDGQRTDLDQAFAFATQLGQVIGSLSKEVVSGGDVGIPLMPDGQAVILPQNFADFGRDLEVPE